VAVVVVVVRMMMVEVVVQADDKIRPCRRGNLSPFRVLVLGLKERSTLVLFGCACVFVIEMKMTEMPETSFKL